MKQMILKEVFLYQKTVELLFNIKIWQIFSKGERGRQIQIQIQRKPDRNRENQIKQETDRDKNENSNHFLVG